MLPAIMAASRVPPAVTVLALAIGVCILRSSLAQEYSPDDYLDPHNAAREEVGVEPLTWDDDLAVYSQQWAEDGARDCSLRHSHGPYGENIYGGSARRFAASHAVKMWVDEKQYYDYASNSCIGEQVCRHYTQVVWADTKRVGCGHAKCPNGVDIVVCNYDPSGNVRGQWPYAISA